MLIGESKESDEDVHDGEGQEPDVSGMPSRVGVSGGRDNDIGQILNAFPQQRSFGMTCVPNHVLGGHDVAVSLDELEREGSEGRCSFVGQLVSVLDKALRKDPVSE